MQRKEIAIEIQNIFDNNKLEDLKRFMRKRECLNQTNMILIYLFHIVQSAGILTTTIAAGYEMKELVWVGAGLNLLASLINIFEQTNNSISKKLLRDITAIKDNTYVDEGIAVPAEKENESGSQKIIRPSEVESPPSPPILEEIRPIPKSEKMEEIQLDV